MPVTVRVEPLEKDIDLIFREDLSGPARSATLAKFAQETVAEAESTNEAALGHPVAYQTFVDGREGAREESVSPDGEIAYEFDIVEDLFAWIGEQLVTHAPVGSASKDPHPGLYARSFKFFADGVEVDPGATVPQTASEFVYLNVVPYSRKIERGESPQAPDGVFQAVAALAQRRFGNVAKVNFEYRAALNPVGKADRSPAIVIRPR